jgi:hypothetical protein
MSSNMSLNIAKMVEDDPQSDPSEDSVSMQNDSLNQSMSILNSSINNDSKYTVNNAYSEHRSLILKYTFSLTF